MEVLTNNECHEWAFLAAFRAQQGQQLPGAAGTSLQEKAGKNWWGVESRLGKQLLFIEQQQETAPTAGLLRNPSSTEHRCSRLSWCWAWTKQRRCCTRVPCRSGAGDWALPGLLPSKEHSDQGLCFSRNRGGIGM